MTPKDALIEKMARAIAQYCGWSRIQAEEILALESTHPGLAEMFRGQARAAYEAEHEEEGK